MDFFDYFIDKNGQLLYTCFIIYFIVKDDELYEEFGIL